MAEEPERQPSASASRICALVFAVWISMVVCSRNLRSSKLVGDRIYDGLRISDERNSVIRGGGYRVNSKKCRL
jgi:hypothetical protein